MIAAPYRTDRNADGNPVAVRALVAVPILAAGLNTSSWNLRLRRLGQGARA